MIDGMLVIGENLNAARKAKVGGVLVRDLGEGRLGIRYADLEGGEAVLDLTEFCQREAVRQSGLCPYVAGAVTQRDAAYLQATARRQVAAGADLLDLCIDEITHDSGERCEHMRWLTRTVQAAAPETPLSFDSSDPAVFAAALEAYDFAVGPPSINSVNLEEARLPLIELAVERGCRLLANASGEARLPEDAAERVANLCELTERMTAAGLAPGDIFLDPLVLPVATDADNGRRFLDAVAELRGKLGPEIHLTGGISNVSFGLPRRKILNLALTQLLQENGGDVAFIDPVQLPSLQAAAADAELLELARTVIRGEDDFCMDYINACRA